MIRGIVRAAAFGATLLLAAAGLTACGSSLVAGAKQPVFVDAVGTNPSTLNPALTTDVTTSIVTSTIYEPLVQLTTDFELKPALATDWQVSADGLTYAFTIRSGVKWHDGQVFTSSDAKFTLEDVTPIHPLGSAISNVLDSVDAPDDTHLIVHLKRQFAPFLEALSGQRILPSHIYKGTSIPTNPANLHPIGTGPYKFESFESGDRIVVSQNTDYWRPSGDVASIIFKIMPDNNARVLAMQSGEVDRIYGFFLNQSQVSTLRADPRIGVTDRGTYPSSMLMFTNTKRGPLKDAAVRRAIYQGLNLQAVAAEGLSGSGVPAIGPIPAQISWATSQSEKYSETLPFDRDAAEKALDAAGYKKGPDGKRFSLTLTYMSGLPTFQSTSEIVKANLQSIGIDVRLVSQEISVWTEQTFTKHNFDLSVVSMATYQDPSLGVARNYVCNPKNAAFANPTGICDQELDDLFGTAATSTSKDERAKAFGEAGVRAQELMGTMPLADEKSKSVLRTDRWAGLDDFAAVIDFDWTALKRNNEN